MLQPMAWKLDGVNRERERQSPVPLSRRMSGSRGIIFSKMRSGESSGNGKAKERTWRPSEESDSR